MATAVLDLTLSPWTRTPGCRHWPHPGAFSNPPQPTSRVLGRRHATSARPGSANFVQRVCPFRAATCREEGCDLDPGALPLTFERPHLKTDVVGLLAALEFPVGVLRDVDRGAGPESDAKSSSRSVVPAAGSLRAPVAMAGQEISCWECHKMVPVPVPRSPERAYWAIREGLPEVFEFPWLLALCLGAAMLTGVLSACPASEVP